MRIVYMGTPEFSVPPLKKLFESGFSVCGVVTSPDKPRGRGKRLSGSPVKQFAQDAGIPVYQPDKLREEEFLKTLNGLSPDVIVVCAYGKILPARVLQCPPAGCVNIHASLLPELRGPNPVQHAILQGKEKTGITTLFMTEKVDAGDMLLQKDVPVLPDETLGSLEQKLSVCGAELIVETLRLLSEGKINPVPQEENRATWAPVLKEEEVRISWEKSAVFLERLVRAANPRPGAYAFYKGIRLKVWEAEAAGSQWPVASGQFQSGTVVDVKNDGIFVQAGDKILNLTQVQREGKQRMSAVEFCRGAQIKTGDTLG